MVVDRSVLSTIRDLDPDGGSIEPTQAHYDAFEASVTRLYGSAVYDAYMNGNLYTSRHNIDGTSDDFYG